MKTSQKFLLLSAAVALSVCLRPAVFGKATKQKIIPIAEFSNSDLSGWKEQSFEGKADYKLSHLDGDDQTVLIVKSKDSASGLFKEIAVDLKKYPYLNWRWRIENRISKGDERTKSGDDYAARIYVVNKNDLFIWRTRAINYVWAQEAQKDDSWPNPYAGKYSIMVAVRSKDDDAGTWYIEKRNVYEDFKKLHGSGTKKINAIAIMADTDNTKSKVKSCFGDIYFSAD